MQSCPFIDWQSSLCAVNHERRPGASIDLYEIVIFLFSLYEIPLLIRWRRIITYAQWKMNLNVENAYIKQCALL